MSHLSRPCMTAMQIQACDTFTPSAWCRGDSPKKNLPNSRRSGRPPPQKSACSANYGIAHCNVAGHGFLRRPKFCINRPHQGSVIEASNPCRCSMVVIIAATGKPLAFPHTGNSVRVATNPSIRRKPYNLSLSDSYDTCLAKPTTHA